MGGSTTETVGVEESKSTLIDRMATIRDCRHSCRVAYCTPLTIFIETKETLSAFPTITGPVVVVKGVVTDMMVGADAAWLRGKTAEPIENASPPPEVVKFT